MRKRIFEKIAGRIICLICLMLIAAASSEAAGRKYALFVGINAYEKPLSPLKGCVNDAQNLQRALAERFGFAIGDTTLLLDAKATRAAILGALRSYQLKARAGDVFVLTYSGHGTLFPDKYSEELDETAAISMTEIGYPLDKYDSAICPFDARDTTSGKPWRNLILDDELYAEFSKFTAKGAQVVFLSDSCHSGTLARSLDGRNLSLPKDDAAAVRFFPFNRIADFDAIGRAPRPKRKLPVKPKRNDLLIVLTGAKDNEFSLDFPDKNGVINGLFTSTLLATIEDLHEQRKKPTYLSVQEIVSPEVNRLAKTRDRNQTPQIDARFFKGSLNATLFSFAGKSAATNNTQKQNPTSSNAIQTNTISPPIPDKTRLRVVVKVTDKAGNPIENAAVGIFNQSAKSLLAGAGGVEKIPSRDIRAAGRTDGKGLYDSKNQSLFVQKGTYLIKVIRAGFAPYIGDVSVVENAEGFCVLVVRLDN